jgi:hypothetical protein
MCLSGTCAGAELLLNAGANIKNTTSLSHPNTSLMNAAMHGIEFNSKKVQGILKYANSWLNMALISM